MQTSSPIQMRGWHGHGEVGTVLSKKLQLSAITVTFVVCSKTTLGAQMVYLPFCLDYRPTRETVASTQTRTVVSSVPKLTQNLDIGGGD